MLARETALGQNGAGIHTPSHSLAYHPGFVVGGLLRSKAQALGSRSELLLDAVVRVGGGLVLSLPGSSGRTRRFLRRGSHSLLGFDARRLRTGFLPAFAAREPNERCSQHDESYPDNHGRGANTLAPEKKTNTAASKRTSAKKRRIPLGNCAPIDQTPTLV